MNDKKVISKKNTDISQIRNISVCTLLPNKHIFIQTIKF